MRDSTKSAKNGIMLRFGSLRRRKKREVYQVRTSLFHKFICKIANSSNSPRDYKDCAVYADLIPLGISYYSYELIILLFFWPSITLKTISVSIDAHKLHADNFQKALVSQ